VKKTVNHYFVEKQVINYPEVAAMLTTTGNNKPSAETSKPLQFFTQLQRATSVLEF